MANVNGSKSFTAATFGSSDAISRDIRLPASLTSASTQFSIFFHQRHQPGGSVFIGPNPDVYRTKNVKSLNPGVQEP